MVVAKTLECIVLLKESASALFDWISVLLLVKIFGEVKDLECHSVSTGLYGTGSSM